MNDFYVYGLVDPRDNSLFYIGKGRKKRMFEHVPLARNNRSKCNHSPKLYARIKEILTTHTDCKYIIYFSNMTEVESLAIESQLISGYNENLCNVAKDGRLQFGQYEYRPKEESTKQKQRIAAIENIDAKITWMRRKAIKEGFTTWGEYQQALFDRVKFRKSIAHMNKIIRSNRIADRLKFFSLIPVNPRKRGGAYQPDPANQAVINLNGCRTVEHARRVLNMNYCTLQRMVTRGQYKLYTGPITPLERSYRAKINSDRSKSMRGRKNAFRWGKSDNGNQIALC